LIVVVRVANIDLVSLVGFASETSPRSPSALAANADAAGNQESSTAGVNPMLVTADGIYAPGTDFRGAYVLGVEHLSEGRSMLEIYVPAGVEGDYQAIVTAAESLEFQCVVLHHYTDRLYCIGTRLEDGSQVNVSIFRIDDGQDSQTLIFQADYTTGEDIPLVVPTQPAFVPYGGGFTWPDRFDDIERQREIESSRLLWPLSTILGAAAFWLLTRVRRDLKPVNSVIGRHTPFIS
jgi:hypothetical protein